MAFGREVGVNLTGDPVKPAPNPKLNKTGAPTRETIIPDDPKIRKQYPIGTGVIDYFPDALAEVAKISYVGNVQHNGPDSELFWNRGKSGDESDAMMRHYVRRGTWDYDKLPDGSLIATRHSAKMVWRALAFLQKEIEDEKKQRMGEQIGKENWIGNPGDAIEYNPNSESIIRPIR